MRFDNNDKKLLRKSTIRRRNRILKVGSKFNILGCAIRNGYVDVEYMTEAILTTHNEKTMAFTVCYNDEYCDNYDVKRHNLGVINGDKD